VISIAFLNLIFVQQVIQFPKHTQEFFMPFNEESWSFFDRSPKHPEFRIGDYCSIEKDGVRQLAYISGINAPSVTGAPWQLDIETLDGGQMRVPDLTVKCFTHNEASFADVIRLGFWSVLSSPASRNSIAKLSDEALVQFFVNLCSDAGRFLDLHPDHVARNIPKINGTGEFTISDSSILQNDGLGTPLGHVRNNATTLINIPEDQKINLTENSSGDKEPPEPFVVEYIPSGFFSKTPSMISFFTTDTISGVEKYQIKDSHSYWKDVVSPFEISKGIVKRSIIVRALDFNGNIRESSVEIPGLLSSLQLLGVFIILISCYFLFFVVKRKR
jgi:hypothetical protein